MAGVRGFREHYLNAGALRTDEFDAFAARQMRYALYWALLENTAYRHIHTWARSLKVNYGLYEFTRGVYNPTARIADAWQTFLMGGALDPQAGDGKDTPSALPILIQGAQSEMTSPLRGALATLWRDSNWQIKKDVLTLRGCVFGDIGLRVMDDTKRGKIYLSIVHPGIIQDIALDPFGNVKGYTIAEMRQDPRATQTRDVTYREECARDGDEVVYRTFLDDQPYAWNAEQGAEWREPYGFVPFVLIRHNDLGGTWGWSEIHSAVAKFFEVDDLASKLDDQVRKTVDAKWLFTGVPNPKDGVITTRGKTSSTSADEDTQRQAKREQEDAYFVPDPNAKAQALVAPLQIADALAVVKEILAELERDYPELQHDIWAAGGDTSGAALSVARQRVETRVLKRRPNYDDALVRAHQMAIAIGGYRRYDGYRGFDLDSYGAGRLDHSIGARPVFQPTRAQTLQEDAALWTAANAAVAAGNTIDAPTAGALLELVLRRNGYTDADLQQIGSLRAAGILNAQEDVVPNVEQ